MMNSLINLGFTGGIGAGFSGNGHNKKYKLVLQQQKVQ
jgi:hypothetical protein